MDHTAPALSAAILAVLLTMCGRPAGEAHPNTAGRQPVDSHGAVLIVTADSIGPLAVAASLGSLRQRFRGHDTLYYGEAGYPPYAALVFSLPGLTAVATQFSRAIDPAQPAEYWTVVGRAALAGGFQTPITYGQLRRAISGPVLVGGSLRLGAEFCSLPGIGFDLGENPGDIKFDSAGSPLNISSDRTIEAVTISRIQEHHPQAHNIAEEWCAKRAAANER